MSETRMRARRVWIALAALCTTVTLSGGCISGAYKQLVSEDDVPELAALKQQAEARPLDVTLVPTQIHEETPTRIAVYETGNRTAQRTIILIHGVLSDHEAWRFVRGDLGEDHRIIMVDLPGNGASDKPSARSLEPDGYSPNAIAQRLWQALDGYFAEHPTPERITLVGHSLGGTIVMFMLVDAAPGEVQSDLTKKVDRVVLFTPADVQLINPPAIFQEIATISDFAVGLATITGILRDRIARGMLHAASRPDRRLREEADRMYANLSNERTRRATQAILRQFVPRLENGRFDWDAIDARTATYADIKVPTLITWGRHDETLPLSMAYRFVAEIPDAHLFIFEHGKHSAHIEAPELAAALIRAFSRTGTEDFRRELEVIGSPAPDGR